MRRNSADSGCKRWIGEFTTTLKHVTTYDYSPSSSGPSDSSNPSTIGMIKKIPFYLIYDKYVYIYLIFVMKKKLMFNFI